MNELKNLLIWYGYNEEGQIERLVNLTAIPANEPVEEFPTRFMMPPTNGGGVEKIVKEHIVVPYSLLGVSGTAFVLYVHGKRFVAVLPYYVMIAEEK